MPGAKQRRLKHIHQGHLMRADGVEKPRIRDFFPELKNLFTNWTFLFNGLGLTCSLLYGSSLVVFMAKIFRLKFGLDPVRAGYVVALLSVTGIGRKLPLDIFCNRSFVYCVLSYKHYYWKKQAFKSFRNHYKIHNCTRRRKFPISICISYSIFEML